MSTAFHWIGFVTRSIIAGLAVAFLVIFAVPQLRERAVHAPTPTAATSVPLVTSFASAVDRAAPSVVSLYTTSVEYRALNPQAQRPRYLARYRADMGSGVLVSEDGFILTNNHVISEVENIKVALWDGRFTDATVVGSDPATDLAVLRVDLDGLPAAPFAEGDVRVGDVVLAIGNALGLSHTVTMGIVSATGRNDLNSVLFEDFIQTDAAINAGNSGGALVNVHGEVVGINTRNLGRAVGGQNIGFAIPISIARDVMRQIVEHGSVQRGWLGAGFLDLPLTQQPDGSEARMGIQVMNVEPGGPAWNANIRTGDILLTIDGEPVDDARAALLSIAQRAPGEEVDLTMVRGGDRFETHAFLIQQPPTR